MHFASQRTIFCNRKGTQKRETLRKGGGGGGGNWEYKVWEAANSDPSVPPPKLGQSETVTCVQVLCLLVKSA